MEKRFQNRRGFTIAEIVIAMAVVVLVTATALTTVLATRKAEHRILQEADAVRLAENVWECFKGTETEDAFLAAITWTEGITPEGAAGNYTLASSKYGYTAVLKVSGNALSVTVGTEEKELLAFSYTKGGAAP